MLATTEDGAKINRFKYAKVPTPSKLFEQYKEMRGINFSTSVDVPVDEIRPVKSMPSVIEQVEFGQKYDAMMRAEQAKASESK